jgi:hypothetical protein
LREECGLRVFENRVLRKICAPKGARGKESGGDSTMRSFLTCTAHQMLFGGSNLEEYDEKGM